jgi:hypothetical protein
MLAQTLRNTAALASKENKIQIDNMGVQGTKIYTM